MKKPVLMIMMTFLGGIFLADMASAASCSDLRTELESLRRAQQSLMTSLANNHDLFADSLEDVSSELDLKSSRVSPTVVRSMKKTAKAFRQRGQQGHVAADKLDTATADLIERIGQCLK